MHILMGTFYRWIAVSCMLHHHLLLVMQADEDFMATSITAVCLKYWFYSEEKVFMLEYSMNEQLKLEG